MAADPLQVFSDELWHKIISIVIPLGILAAFAGFLFKAFENWSVRKIRTWRKGRDTNKSIDRNWQPPSSEDFETPHCPVCNRLMVIRQARTGENVGSKFWGRSAFPKCRG